MAPDRGTSSSTNRKAVVSRSFWKARGLIRSPQKLLNPPHHPLPQESLPAPPLQNPRLPPFPTPVSLSHKNPKSSPTTEREREERERGERDHGFRRRLQGQGNRAGQPPQVRCSRGLPLGPLPRRHRRPPPVQHPGQGGQPLRRRRRLQRPRPRHPQLLLAGRDRPARRADQHGPSAVSHGGRRISDRRPLLHCWGWRVAARTLGGQGGRRRGVPQGADAGADQGSRGGARGQEHPGDQGRGREAALGRRRRRLRGAEVQPPHRGARC
uniref:Uncharacterized protein n=1 Tax=Triticum urartu TaxID=4572 RepID=A0A8R7UZL7_TRIUA